MRELADRLKEAGVRVWPDEAEIKVSDSLTEKIGQALVDADFVGAVLSTNSVKASGWNAGDDDSQASRGRVISSRPISLTVRSSGWSHGRG